MIEKTFQAIVQYLIPEQIKRDSDIYHRSKILVGTAIIYLSLLVVSVPILILVFPNSRIKLSIQLIGAILASHILVAAFFKITGRLSLTLNLLLSSIGIVLLIAIMTVGTSIIPVLLVLPVLAEMVNGRLWSFVWIFIFSCFHVGIVWLLKTDHPIVSGINIDLTSHRTVFCWVLICCVVIAALKHFETITSRLRKKIEEQRDEFKYLAGHDPLTTLNNRGMFAKLLQLAIHRTDREGRCIALMYIDLDRFKQINDDMGHQAGDIVLKTIATRLKDITRAADCVARIGGDEFAIIMESITNINDMDTIGDKVLRNCAKPININDETAQISASIGIAIYPDHADNAETLEKSADIAMYKAKAIQNSCIVYSPEKKEKYILI